MAGQPQRSIPRVRSSQSRRGSVSTRSAANTRASMRSRCRRHRVSIPGSNYTRSSSIRTHHAAASRSSAFTSLSSISSHGWIAITQTLRQTGLRSQTWLDRPAAASRSSVSSESGSTISGRLSSSLLMAVGTGSAGCQSISRTVCLTIFRAISWMRLQLRRMRPISTH